VYEQALARCDANARLPGQAWTLFALGQHLNFRGRFAEAVVPLERALKLARELGDDECAGSCLNKIAYARAYIGDTAGARACIEEELELHARGGSASADLCGAFITKAAICRMHGDLEEAATAIERALSLSDRSNFEELHVTFIDRARIFIAQGRMMPALQSLIEAMRLLPGMASRYRMTMALDVASLLAAAYGDWQRAARLQGTFETTLGTMGGFKNPYDDRAQAKLRERSRKQLGEDSYAREYAAGRRVSPEQAFAETLPWLERQSSGEMHHEPR
jgi:tetratricopeptide (TPR) repeat protein